MGTLVKWIIWPSNGAAQGNVASAGEMEQISKMELVTVKWSMWLSNGADQGNGACHGEMEQISEMEHLREIEQEQ